MHIRICYTREMCCRSCDAVSADVLSSSFTSKVDRIRASTADSPQPIFSAVREGVDLSTFARLTVDDISVAISRLPDKSSAADALPVSQLKQVSDLLTPFLTHLFNRSLDYGRFPTSFKHAYITPILKKPGLPEDDPASYRPISNLSIVSKLLERLVARQLVAFVESHQLLPPTQSGFRRGHSTETAVSKVLSDLLDAVDRGDTAMLALLDLSAAFDTVDHAILLDRLRISFGIHYRVHDWFRSYLLSRTQRVRCGDSSSTVVDVLCGVPQGSVLGPLLFVLYTLDLPSVASPFGLSLHQYADDSQIYGCCQANDTSALSSKITACTTSVAQWMCANRLQLNADKTDVMWCASARRASRLPTDTILVAGVNVQPVSTVRDLGVLIDSDLGAKSHARLIVSRCFAALRQLRVIRRYVNDDCFRSLVVSLIHSRLDYGNFIFIGSPVHRLRLIQSVLNAAARLTLRLRRYDHVTDALAMLHWLRMPERIDYKLAVMAYNSLHGQPPSYLSGLQRVADLPGRRQLRSSTSGRLVIPVHRLATIGRRSFHVAASTLWNTLPADVQFAPSLPVFRSKLKTFLFRRSFPDIIL